MKFRNKTTKEIVIANSYALNFAYSHNSNWEKIKETSKTKKQTTQETKDAQENINDKETIINL